MVVSCAPEDAARLREIAVKYGVAADLIAQTAPNNLEIAVDGRVAVLAAVSDLRRTWEEALERALHTDATEAATVR